MGQFLKQTFASLVGTLVALSLLGVVGFGGLMLLLVGAIASADEEPSIKNKSVLVFDLSVQISDTEPSLALAEALSDEAPKAIALRQVLKAIDKAAKDERIVALFLDGSQGDSLAGYATLTEVRTALEKFRESGKKIIAYDVDWGERDYYLASVADTVVLNPMGVVEMNGMSAQQIFLAGAFEKFGIGVQAIRVGKYKGAVEPFIQKQLSPENRQQLTAVIGDLWQEFLVSVGESRKIAPAKLQEIANQKGLLLPEDAKAEKLVDRIAYSDEVVADLKELTGSKEKDKSFRQVSLGNYTDIPVKNVKRRSSDNKIAILYAQGPIVGGEGEDGQIGSDRLRRELRDLREDEDVKAVVLRINSPGGSATASELILRQLQLLGKEKPAIVSMGNVAASGGYWIATGADYIFAEPNTITGSIGVFGLLPNIEEISKNNGITWDMVKTGNFADLDSISRPKNPQELALYQRLVNKIYNLFLDKVSESRKIPRAKVAQIAQGRIWSGEDAKAIGLVDQLGGIEAAIAYAAQKAELEDDWEVQEYLEDPSFEQQLIRLLRQEAIARGTVPPDPLSQEFLNLKADLEVLRGLSDPKGVHALLPFQIRID